MRKKIGGRDFQKGWEGGPGRPALSPELKEARKLTKELFEKSVTKLTQMTAAEVQAYVKTSECTSLEAMIVGQIRAAINGKTSPIGFLLDRTIGPVKQQMHLEVEDSISKRLGQMSDEQKLKLIDEVNLELKVT